MHNEDLVFSQCHFASFWLEGQSKISVTRPGISLNGLDPVPFSVIAAVSEL